MIIDDTVTIGPLAKERFSLVETEGEAVLLDLRTGHYLGLNAQAFYLWKSVFGSAVTKASLIRSYAVAFSVDDEDAVRHVDVFLRELKVRNLA